MTLERCGSGVPCTGSNITQVLRSEFEIVSLNYVVSNGPDVQNYNVIMTGKISSKKMEEQPN